MVESTYDDISEVADTERSLQFTGIVVTYNEERHLRECLNSLRFCEQLIVIDLGSRDASIEIAETFGAQVICHERVEAVEEIRPEAISYARNEWVVLLDPDEVLPSGIEHNLQSLIEEEPDLGVIRIPIRFYVKGEPLHVTAWGHCGARGKVRHRHRNRFVPYVHRGVELLDGFGSVTLSGQSNCCIKHYWVDSYRQMLRKHWRYLKREGESRYSAGERFYLRGMLSDSLRQMKRDLVDFQGLCGGLRGVFLSCFHGLYTLLGWLALWRYERIHTG